MIRSLSRGLEILTLLNRRDSASAGEFAKELNILRATVYRILETLCEKGLVHQHESDQRFRITPKVRTLSDGFTDEDHIAYISRRYLKRVTKKLNWPVALATWRRSLSLTKGPDLLRLRPAVVPIYLGEEIAPAHLHSSHVFVRL